MPKTTKVTPGIIEELNNRRVTEDQGKRSPRPHSCKSCGKRFALLEKLSRHQMIHSAQRPFPCTYCSKSFRLSQHLKEHIRTHTGEKPYKCNICGHAFCQISNLKSHQKTHTREKEYRCDICQKQFRRSFTLKQHRQIHANTNSRQTETKKLPFVKEQSQADQAGSQASAEDVAKAAIRAEKDSKAKSENEEGHKQMTTSQSDYPYKQLPHPTSRSASTFNFENSLLRRQQEITLTPPPLLPLWSSAYRNDKGRISSSHVSPYLDALTYDALTKYSKSIESAEFQSHMQNLFQPQKVSTQRYSSLAPNSTSLPTFRTASVAEKNKLHSKSTGEVQQPNHLHDRYPLYKSFSEHIHSARSFDMSEFGRFTFSKTINQQKNSCKPETKTLYRDATTPTTQVSNSASSESISGSHKPNTTKAVSPSQDYKWKRQLCEVWRKPTSSEEAIQRPKSIDVTYDLKNANISKLKLSVPSSASNKSPTRAALFARKESHYSSSYEDDVFSPNSLASSSSNSSREALSSSDKILPQPFSGKRTVPEFREVFPYPSSLPTKRFRKQAEAKYRDAVDVEKPTCTPTSPGSLLDKEVLSPMRSSTEFPLKPSSPGSIRKEQYLSPIVNFKHNNVFSFEKPFLNEQKKTENVSVVSTDLSTDYSRLSLAADRVPHIDFPFSSHAELKSLSGQFSFVPLVSWKPVVTGWRNIFDGNVYPVHPQVEGFANAALQQQTY